MAANSRWDLIQRLEG